MLKNKYDSEKNFGFVFALVFFFIGIYLIFNNNSFLYLAFIISFTFFIFSFLLPKIFFIPSKLWLKFSTLLSKLMLPLLMWLIYMIAIVPVGLVFKLILKDPLKLKKNSSTSTYWINRKVSETSMTEQF